MIKEEILKTATDSVLDKLLFKRQIGEEITVTPDDYCEMFRAASAETKAYLTTPEQQLIDQTRSVIRAADDIDQSLDKIEIHLGLMSVNVKSIELTHQTLNRLENTTSVTSDDVEMLKSALMTMASQLQLTNSQLAASQREVISARAKVHHLETEITTDHLTKAPNRAAMEKTLTALEASKTPFAAITCDLNFFKMINDSLGHDAGDEVLKVFAQRVQLNLKGSDRIYRMGGDEFTVILEGVMNPAQIKKVVGRLKAAVTSEPISIDGKEIPISTSMGGAFCDWTTVTRGEQVFKAADVELYKDKESSERMMARIELTKALTEQVGTVKGIRV